MTVLMKIPYLLCSIVMICSCNTTKEKKKTSSNNPIVITPNNKSPDPSLEVKDDFTLLTKADEEKEDKSHMDMSYFPSNYALDKALNKPVQIIARVVYSRPHKSGRPQIFGDSNVLVPYGKLWRLGANETTEIEFMKTVLIEGKKINPGRYGMYAIPHKNKWSIVFNTDLFTFGDFNYNPTKDILKADASVNAAKFSLETFLIYFQKTNVGCNLIFSWDTVVATLPISIP